MKLINALAIASLTVITVGLAACGKTKTDSNASTPVATSTCTRSYDGTMRDQYGRSCAAYGQNNIPYDGTNLNPYQQGTGCQGWSQLMSQQYGYQIYYVPVDVGNGQLICMNAQQMPQAQNVNWYDPYYQQYPPYSCQSYDCGQNYGGNTCLNFNYQGYSSSIGAGVCF